MSLTLPPASPTYDANDQQRTRDAMRQADAQNLKRNTDLQFITGKVMFRENKIILTSPDQTEFYLTVSDAGVLAAVAV